MIPMRLSVREGDLPPHEFVFEVARHADLTPALAGTAVASALVRDIGFDQEVTARATGEVKLRDLPVVPLDLAATSGGGPHPFLAVAGQIQRLLLTLHANPFEEPEVEGVDLDVNVRRERVAYRLEEVHHDRRSVRPGDALRLECVLRSYRGPRESRVLTLTVPPDLLPGTPLALIVGDPSAVDRALGQPLAQRLGSARDLGAWVRVLAEATPADRLEAVLYRPAGGAIVDGLELDDLTPTAAHLLAPREAGARRIASPLVRAAVRLDGPVDGEIRRSLVVDSGARGEESP
jgi:hypothetical protein